MDFIYTFIEYGLGDIIDILSHYKESLILDIGSREKNGRENVYIDFDVIIMTFQQSF